VEARLLRTGRARWPLLQTYHDERRDVSQRITGQSLENSINVLRIVAAATGGDSGDEHGGHRHASPSLRESPRRRVRRRVRIVGRRRRRHVASAGGGQLLGLRADRHARLPAPHVWLGRPDAQLSTLDLFGSAFTLLAAPDARRLVRCAAVERAMRSACASTAIGSASAGLNDLGGFTSAYERPARRRRARRPDGHVAWRSPSAPVTGSEVENAMGHILAR
jgi:hypothetical protein